MRKLLPFALIVLTYLAVTAFVREKAITLELNLEQGAAYLIHTTNSQQLSTKIGNQSMDNKMNMAFDMDWKVTHKYGKDSTLIEATYNTFTMDMNVANQKIHIDSKESHSSIDQYLSRAIALTREHPIVVKTNAQGDILAIRGTDVLRKAAKDSLEGAPATMQQAMDKLFSPDKLRSRFSLISIFPKKPVAVGDSWEKDMLLDSVTAIMVHQKFTLKSFNPKTAILSVSSQIKNTKDSMTFNGLTVPAEITGTQSGEYTVDRASGLLTDGVINQKMAVKISLMGQSVVINTTGENRIAESRKK